MNDQEKIHQEWIENVQTWFDKGNLWGGLRLERRDDVVKVWVTDYMDLTRRISVPFDSYETALAAVGACMDEYQQDAGEWLQPHRTTGE